MGRPTRLIIESERVIQHNMGQIANGPPIVGQKSIGIRLRTYRSNLSVRSSRSISGDPIFCGAVMMALP